METKPILKYLLVPLKLKLHECNESGDIEEINYEWRDILALNEWHEAEQGIPKMHRKTAFHFYDSPDAVAFMAPIHSDIPNPRLFEIEIDGIVKHNGHIGCSKKMRIIREMPIPELSLDLRLAVAITCAMNCGNKGPEWVKWAENWLSGKDRSYESAKYAWVYASEGSNSRASKDAAMAVMRATQNPLWKKNARWQAPLVAAFVWGNEFWLSDIIEKAKRRF